MINYIIQLMNKPEYLWTPTDQIIFDVWITAFCIVGFAVVIGGYFIAYKIIEWWRKHK